ncbi:MAG: response regulator [Candidatus Dormibacteraceae bacterium]
MSRILIAEDNVLNFELVRDILESRDHQVEWARDGSEALRMALAGDFDLILLDLHMPKVDGIAVLRALRGARTGAVPKVVVVSADAMGGVPEAAAEAGADGYLAKPIEVGALVEEIDRHLD